MGFNNIFIMLCEVHSFDSDLNAFTLIAISLGNLTTV